MDKCREEFEKQKYWIGLFRDAVDFDEELGRYVLNGQRKLYAFHLDSFNEKWAIWQEAWQHQQAKVEELQTQLSLQRQRVKAFEEELTSSRNYGDELQKRVGQQGLIIAKVMSIASDLQKSWSMFEIGKKLEQAIKGEG
ncbi:hypothetical protein [Acinetobacter baumannii]|uniref:hypothetical protein n=1 Tax=Acinetobacter baumannii TaxID=470 RepID=UPI0021F26662|nr:hypothetical protein [Acinetobacter baumannii]